MKLISLDTVVVVDVNLDVVRQARHDFQDALNDPRLGTVAMRHGVALDRLYKLDRREGNAGWYSHSGLSHPLLPPEEAVYSSTLGHRSGCISVDRLGFCVSWGDPTRPQETEIFYFSEMNIVEKICAS